MQHATLTAINQGATSVREIMDITNFQNSAVRGHVVMFEKNDLIVVTRDLQNVYSQMDVEITMSGRLVLREHLLDEKTKKSNLVPHHGINVMTLPQYTGEPRSYCRNCGHASIPSRGSHV